LQGDRETGRGVFIHAPLPVRHAIQINREGCVYKYIPPCKIPLYGVSHTPYRYGVHLTGRGAWLGGY
jgi:hypothetical protein